MRGEGVHLEAAARTPTGTPNLKAILRGEPIAGPGRAGEVVLAVAGLFMTGEGYAGHSTRLRHAQVSWNSGGGGELYALRCVCGRREYGSRVHVLVRSARGPGPVRVMVMCVAAKHGQRTRLLVLNSLSRAITRARVCTNMSASIGMRSPPPLSPSPRLGSSQSSPRLPGLSLSSRQSNASPIPRPQFDAELLKAYMKKLLATTLLNASWPEAKDRDRVKAWMKEIGERVKERMVEIQGKGL